MDEDGGHVLWPELGAGLVRRLGAQRRRQRREGENRVLSKIDLVLEIKIKGKIY